MAIVHADDFEIYGRNAAYMTNGVYAEAGLVTLVADPSGEPGTILQLDGSAVFAARLRKVLPAYTNTAGVAARYWLPSLPVSNGSYPMFASYRSAGNAALFTVLADPTGRLLVKAGDFSSSTVLGTTANPVITANGWFHIETKIVVSATTGSVEIRVEGRTVLLIENIDTGTTPIAQISLQQRPEVGELIQLLVKDYVIWDGSGSQNNDFVGTVLLQGLDMVADVDLNWSPVGAATGYEILATKPPENSKYISAIDPPPAAYVGSMSQLPDDVTSVKGLVTYIRAAKIDGGDASLQVGLISSPDDAPETVEGADRPITVAQTYWLDVFEQDPKTLAPWTPQAVNTVNFKINRTT